MKQIFIVFLGLALFLQNPGLAGAQDQNPFAGTNWLQVLQQDPTLREDPKSAMNGYHYFAEKNGAGGGMFMGNQSVVTGQVSGEWVAAMALASGGSGAAFTVIAYTKDSPNQTVVSFNAKYGHMDARIDERGLVLVVPHYLPNMCNACYTQLEESIYAYRDGKFMQMDAAIVDIPKSPVQSDSTPKPFHAESVPISNYASFNKWFKTQPGSNLTLDAWTRPTTAPAANNTAGETIFAVPAEMKFYKGPIGGGIGGYYDALNGIAEISVHYDTYVDLLLIATTTAPMGLPNMYLKGTGTMHGAMLGMTIAQVQAIEGPGRRIDISGNIVLAYAWILRAVGNMNETASLRFMFHNGRCVAIDYGDGV